MPSESAYRWNSYLKGALIGHYVNAKFTGTRSWPNQSSLGYQSSSGPLIKNGGFDVAIHDTGTRPEAVSGISISGGVSAPEPMSLLLVGPGSTELVASRMRSKTHGLRL